jgi:hypothetical protein
MRLRAHPLMRYRGISNWPPVWLQTTGSRSAKLEGEIGILKSVGRSQVEPTKRCYLSIEFEDEFYLGTLLFEDGVFCRQVYQLLQNHVGKSIKEIGDLEVSQTL